MAEDSSFRDIQVTSSEIQIRKIGVKDIQHALREGYDDFTATPSFGVFLILIYPLFAVLLTLLVLGDNLLYLLFPMIAGSTLLGPVVSTCLFEMSRRREQGLSASWRRAFDFVHSSAFAPIVALSIAMMILYGAWMYMAQLLYFGLFTIDPPASISEFMSQLFTTRRGAGLMLYGTVIGFLCASTALAMSVVAFPLILDRPVSSATAVVTSIKAVTANPLMMALWGAIVVVLLSAGAILFLVGLAAVLPILGHATWHLFRKLVEP